MRSILKSVEESKLIELCDSVLGPLGFRTVDLDFRISGRSLVRVFIERLKIGSEALAQQLDGELHGVTIDDCTSISEKLGSVLDSRLMIPGSYNLEVSSPGLDRRLRLQNDFEPYIGQEVRVLLATSRDGRSKISGLLKSVEDGAVLLSAQGEDFSIPLEDMIQAVRVWRENIESKKSV